MIASSGGALEDGAAAPLDGFSQCHGGILAGLASFTDLPDLAAAAQRSRSLAQDTLTLFEHAVLSHHADEERELFPAVIHSATPAERGRVQAMGVRLTAEHRVIERFWKALKPAVAHLAAGKDAALDPLDVASLVQAYARHAAFEELEFLPLAREILGRNGNHMAALELSLHLRHAPQPVGYI